MLCPNCGANVGDSVALCTNCAEQRKQKLEQAAAARAAEPQPPPGMSAADRKKLIGLMGGGVAILMFVLLAVLLITEKSGSHAPTAAQSQDPFYTRCVVVFRGGEMMRQQVGKEAAEKGGLAGGAWSMLSDYAAAGTSPEEGCEAQRKFCESEPTSVRCKQQRMVMDLFFVMQNVCHSDGFKSMGTPECQQIYETCVAPTNLETPACQSLLKRYGV